MIYGRLKSLSTKVAAIKPKAFKIERKPGQTLLLLVSEESTTAWEDVCLIFSLELSKFQRPMPAVESESQAKETINRLRESFPF